MKILLWRPSPTWSAGDDTEDIHQQSAALVAKCSMPFSRRWFRRFITEYQRYIFKTGNDPLAQSTDGDRTVGIHKTIMPHLRKVSLRSICEPLNIELQ